MTLTFSPIFSKLCPQDAHSHNPSAKPANNSNVSKPNTPAPPGSPFSIKNPQPCPSSGKLDRPRNPTRSLDAGSNPSALAALVAASVIATRELGWMQSAELKAFDLFMRSRRVEPTDSRLLIVGIDNNDIKTDETARENIPIQQRGGGSISNAALDRLLAKITAAQPRMIGLDLYRDFPTSDQPTIVQRLKITPNLIAICRSSNAPNDIPDIKPPPGLPDDRLGFADFVLDPDGRVRRHFAQAQDLKRLSHQNSTQDSMP